MTGLDLSQTTAVQHQELAGLDKIGLKHLYRCRLDQRIESTQTARYAVKLKQRERTTHAVYTILK